MNSSDLIPHLFKTEYGKLVAVLTRSFGLAHIEVAEDIASDTFLAALNTWPYKGIPPNPAAWLYTVAKNKTRNHISRDQVFQTKLAQQLVPGLPTQHEISFSEETISDSQLQMLFAVCHPAIPVESQICLALRSLCGLSLDEIANAFLTSSATIHKRLQRARKTLLSENIRLEMPDPSSINDRLDTVLQTIYLLFSEGYYSESNERTVRTELCIEALNLNYLLLDHPIANNHSSNSLMALLCFQSSRLQARDVGKGHVLYDEQDRNLWDTELIERGFQYLQLASKWPVTSRYYLEASIAYWHTIDDLHAEKWPSILKLYDGLLLLNVSPVVALNRLWAYSKVFGNDAGITAALELNLQENHFYHMLLAELYKSKTPVKSLFHLRTAFQLAITNPEKEFITSKIKELENNISR